MDYMKGSKRLTKPLAKPVDMSVGKDLPSDEDAFERGYNTALSEMAEGSTDMSRQQVIQLLESAEHASRHGKTIAKSLRSEWGIE